MAKAPVWFGATDAFVKVPKFSVIFVTRLVGDHGTDAPSALMAVEVAVVLRRGAASVKRWCGVKQLFTS